MTFPLIVNDRSRKRYRDPDRADSFHTSIVPAGLRIEKKELRPGFLAGLLRTAIVFQHALPDNGSPGRQRPT
jgi:hypothetical protein